MGRAVKDNDKQLKHNMRMSFQGWFTGAGVIAHIRPYSAMALPNYFYCDAHWDLAL